MKSLYTRRGAALLCAATLAACGGSGGNLQLSGTITGLTTDRSDLILSNNGKQFHVVGAVGTFALPDLVNNEDDFEVKVDQNPTGQICTPVNNKSKANAYTVSQIVINCQTTPYRLGGKVSGLDVGGLILANGSLQVAVPANATSFEFPDKVSNGFPYGITVLVQPVGKLCTVANGVAAKMPPNDFIQGTANNTIAVTCVPKPPGV
ncbi:MAG: hypothetical protein V4724_15335 [Pseudomonadota bacterium]